VVRGTNIFLLLALGIGPLALSVACEKQSKEEIIAEYQAQKAEEERVAKLEAELAALKEQQTADNTMAQQIRDEHQAALEKQLTDAQRRAAQAAKEAKEAKEAAATKPNDRRRGDGAGGDQQQESARPSVVNLPQGTKLVASLSAEVSTDTHKAGDPWSGTLSQDVALDGQTVWKAGTRVAGTVSQSAPTGRLANGEGALAIRLTEIGGAGIDGGIYAVTGDSKGARNAKVIGGTAALGALVGVLADKNSKGDHALGGAAIGAAVGTALAAGSGTTVIKMPASTAITFQLPSAERVVVRNR
jgi:hypothetical protein